MLLVIDARGKEQGVDWTGIDSVPKSECPQTFDRDWPTAKTAQQTLKLSGGGLERRDLAATELADEQPAACFAKACRRQSKPPRCVHPRSILEPLEQYSIRIKRIDKTKFWSRHFIFLIFILLGEGDENLAIDGLHIERREPGGNIWIGESSRRNGNLHVASIKNIDAAVEEIRHVKKVCAVGLGDRCVFVYRRARIDLFHNSVRLIRR